MQIGNSPKRFGDHHNAFGFLRLLLASLVIVSHTPELFDGDRNREILTAIFHTLSFGEVAVNGFFIVSGFLITASFINSPYPVSYLRKRILRIYPGFVISSLLCVSIVGPLAGGSFDTGIVRGIVSTLARILVLCPPFLPGTFSGTSYPLLNGAAWTIQYEFLCYLIILALGYIGALRTPVASAVIAATCLLIYSFAPVVGGHLNHLPLQNAVLTGDRQYLFRFIGLFLSGSTYFYLRDRLRFTKTRILIAAISLCVTMCFDATATIGFAVFGAYLIFAVAMLGSGTVLSRINNRNDVSYGLYLYAWPIEKLLLWWKVTDDLIVLGVVTCVLSAGAGAASWFLVEKPIMRLARPRPKMTATARSV